MTTRTKTPVDATRWFDTLTPIDPPGFADDHPGWCTRHMAPAVRLGGNDRGATLQLGATVVSLVRAKLPTGWSMSASEIMRQLAARDADGNLLLEPACCIAGDDLMYALWQSWLPKGRKPC